MLSRDAYTISDRLGTQMYKLPTLPTRCDTHPLVQALHTLPVCDLKTEEAPPCEKPYMLELLHTPLHK